MKDMIGRFSWNDVHVVHEHYKQLDDYKLQVDFQPFFYNPRVQMSLQLKWELDFVPIEAFAT